MGTRLTMLTPQSLDAAQAALYERIAGGPRKSMGVSLADDAGALIGPFNAYLHTPELGARLEAAGVGLRECTVLKPRHRELAILVSARHHRAQFEGYAHAIIARREGVSEQVVDAILTGREPRFEDAADASVYGFAAELLVTHRASKPTFEALCVHLDERERVELVFVLGYYALVSMTLNTFEVALPEGVEPPFPE
jgi:4-carboxymuconolactone decarboxylase